MKNRRRFIFGLMLVLVMGYAPVAGADYMFLGLHYTGEISDPLLDGLRIVPNEDPPI